LPTVSCRKKIYLSET